jgi:hypothetical protein
MKPEAQRIAIAKACGWTKFTPDTIQYTARRSDGKWGPIPDYLNDLNAMHEAEIGMEPPTFKKYSSVLIADVIGWSAYNNEHIAIRATAAQRAEAFLKTLGLWTD